MATKLINSKYHITLTVKYSGSTHIWLEFDFNNKFDMLNWIKKYNYVNGSTNDYEIAFKRIDYTYDDTTKRITRTETTLTADDL